jgi:WD40 repeat protein
VDPFRETFKRIFPNGGIGIVEMLFRCNLLAIVGGGRNPRYPTNKVMIWDDHQNKCIGELKFRTEVHAVRLRRDRVVVVLESKVFVYRFKDLKLLDQITTVANPKGLVALCPEGKNNVLAVPGLNRGIIRIELYDIAKATLIKAHDADLAQFALNADGSRIASASEKGTLIRIWNCHNGEPLRELRRGMDRAEIYCIAFNPASTFIACSSDKGTVHIYSLTGAVPKTRSGQASDANALEAGESSRTNANAHLSSGKSGVDGDFSAESNKANSTSSAASTAGANDAASSTSNKLLAGKGINFLKGILPGSLVPKYFESEWSFAQVRGIEGRSICAFGKDPSRIVVVSADGTFIVASFEDGGDCARVSTAKFLRNRDENVAPGEDAASWAASGLVGNNSSAAPGAGSLGGMAQI